MRAVDTNIVVRLITHDDPKHLAAARAFIAPGAWVSHVVLTEVAWVLEAVYDRSAAQIAATIEILLHHEHLTLQDAETISAALDQFRQHPTVGFSDCLILEITRKSGNLPLGTFDRPLAKLDAVERL